MRCRHTARARRRRRLRGAKRERGGHRESGRRLCRSRGEIPRERRTYRMHREPGACVTRPSLVGHGARVARREARAQLCETSPGGARSFFLAACVVKQAGYDSEPRAVESRYVRTCNNRKSQARGTGKTGLVKLARSHRSHHRQRLLRPVPRLRLVLLEQRHDRVAVLRVQTVDARRESRVVGGVRFVFVVFVFW